MNVDHGSEWSRQLLEADYLYKDGRVRRSAIKWFLRELVYPLDIEKGWVKGDLLIIGPGPIVPEAAIFCSPESDFHDLYEQISSVVLCEGEHFPINASELEMTNFNDHQKGKNGGIFLFAGWADEILIGESQFDLISFFRIPDMEGMVDSNLFQRTVNALKPGGVFMGSGSFSKATEPPHRLADDKRIKLIRWQGLSNPSTMNDSFGEYPFSHHHIGFVVKKNP